jgi:LysM repeat protein
MKRPRWVAWVVAVCLVLITTSVVVVATYHVRGGDTLTSTARHYNTTVDNVAKEDNIANSDSIYVDQVLWVPDTGEQGGTYVVEVAARPGRNAWRERLGTYRALWEQALSELNEDALDDGPFSWKVSGGARLRRERCAG